VKREFPPLDAVPLNDQRGQSYPRLIELMQRLLAPDGCPWDREQSYATLRRYVVEEAAEVVDAIDGEDSDELRDELGDLLLQVVFLGELGRRDGRFGPDDVVKSIVDKLVRRHPHVFADVEVEDSGEVLNNWERIKAGERKRSGKMSGVLGSVPRSLPALVRAQRVGEKAGSVGFDWPDMSGPRAKVNEELNELDEAIHLGEGIEEELGDALFALVNLARHLKIDAEGALRSANTKFIKRFGHVEARVDQEHGGFDGDAITLDTLEGYWNEAK
jgi:MazG family protein